MRRLSKYTLAGFSAVALAAATAHGQIYSFETLYDSTNTINPAGTRPDDFYANGSGTTITQSTIGVTNGNYSMDFAQTSGATFTGALTEVVPAIINDPNTTAISVDVTIPATGNYTGAFARMGISEFGNNASQGVMGQQVQTIPNSEVNLDLQPGTYHLTIPLIAYYNPLTGDPNVPFSSCFGSDPNTQLTAYGFEFYINKAADQPLNVYLDNVVAVGPQTVGTWAKSSGGSWGTLADWTGGIPKVALDTANFGSALTSSSTVTLDGNRSVGTLSFNNSSASYTIAQGTAGTLTLDNGGYNIATVTDSAGSHTISAPVYLNSNTSITVARAGDLLNFAGNVNGFGSVTVAGNGTVELAGTNAYTGGTTVSSGTLLLGSATALPTSNAVINIGAGATVKLGHSIGGVAMQLPAIAGTFSAGVGGSLVYNGTSTIDINNDHILINYAGGADPLASVVALIKSGFANGAWTGPGITSSAAAATSGSYGVGFADSADPGNPAGLASGQIEVAYTLLGDANLDGKVNGADFAILATNFNKAVTGLSGWDQGDFNNDGKINGADFAALAGNFNKGASLAATDLAALDSFAQANGLNLVSVPEPSMGIALAAAASVFAARRRRSM
jgi:autotransporter-associated beta strand protein